MVVKANVEIDSHAQEVLEAKEGAIAKILEEFGLLAERNAKLYCPVDTGRLRNSISHATDGDTMYVGTNVEYAAYVEMGTSRQKAQPYLQPAIVDHMDEYQRVVENELRNA